MEPTTHKSEVVVLKPGPEVIQLFFVLISAEQTIVGVLTFIRKINTNVAFFGDLYTKFQFI